MGLALGKHWQRFYSCKSLLSSEVIMCEMLKATDKPIFKWREGDYRMATYFISFYAMHRNRDCPIKSLLFDAKLVQVLKLQFARLNWKETRRWFLCGAFSMDFGIFVFVAVVVAIQLQPRDTHIHTGKTTISFQSMVYSTNTDETAI